MSEPNDEDRALLDAYAQASSPSATEVERALARTLAHIEGEERMARLPDRRHRFVWIAAAGLASLAIASAAVAGVRWHRARAQSQPESYGAARLDRVDESPEVRGREHVDTSAPVRVEPDPEPATELEQAAELPAPPRDPSPRPRQRTKPAQPEPSPANDEAPPSDAPPTSDASQLAAESRLLGLVRKALRDNDFAAALMWADEHARSYPKGALTEERLILEAAAACRGGQRERGLAAIEQLREQFPSTSALAKVEQSCAE